MGFDIPKLKDDKPGKSAKFVKSAERRSTAKQTRITVDLDPDLHRRMKIQAAMEGCTLADLVRNWADEKCSNAV